MKKRTVWLFQGDVYVDGTADTYGYEAATVAGSFQEAYRNIVYNYKTKYHKDERHLMVDLVGNLNRVAPQKEYKSTKQKLKEAKEFGTNKPFDPGEQLKIDI